MTDAPEGMEIWLEGHDHRLYCVSALGNPDEGAEGITLAMVSAGTMWEDLYEADVDTIYNSTAFEIGGRYGGLREKMIEFQLAFHVKATNDRPWRINDSRFRKSFSYTKDSKMRVKIIGVSERWLTIRMRGKPKLKVETDPNNRKYGLLLVTFVAPYPRWVEDDFVSEVFSTTDTTSSGTEIKYVTASNPTDTEVWTKWVLQAGNANIVYTLPDFSFGDDRFDHATTDDDRMVEMPALVLGEHVVVDTDEMSMNGQVNSSLDTAIYQRMNNREFLYPLPPYTDPIQLPVIFGHAAIGNGIQLRIPRTWTRPWGME